MTKQKELNLGNLFGDDAVDLKILTREHPDDRESRLRIQEAEAAHQRREKELLLEFREAEAVHQRRKDLYLLFTTVSVVVVVFCVCVFVILSGKYAPETEKTMLALLTLIIGGLVGYLTGKSSK